MTATITWSIDRLDVKPALGEYTDVVIVAYYRCSGVQGSYTSSVSNTCTLQPPTAPFIPYDQLTQDQVLEWCWSSGVNKAAAEAAVQKYIDTQINPPVISPPLPWV